MKLRSCQEAQRLFKFPTSFPSKFIRRCPKPFKKDFLQQKRIAKFLIGKFALVVVCRLPDGHLE